MSSSASLGGRDVDAMTPLIEEAPEVDVGQWLASVAHDPVEFVRTAFRWGEGELRDATGPEEWQQWLLEQIRDGLLKPGEAIKLAVASGHGSGKSCLAAWVALWAMSTSPDCRGIVTASSEAMLYTRFRAELRTWFRRFRAKEYFEMGATSLTSADPEHSATWRLDMTPWSETRSETLAGLHNKGRRILCIFDEASAIADSVWETVEPIVTDQDVQAIWVCFGNPLRPSGRFKDCFDKYRHRWITRHIDSRTISFTNKLELERWIQDYGADSDFVRTRILGEFPRVGSSMFISPELVDRAMGRELIPSAHDPLIVGVDVARYGSDASCIFARRGHDCRSIPFQVFRGLSIAELEDRCVWFHNQYHPVQWFIDGGGVGGGLIDHLRRRNLLVIDVQFGSRADQPTDGIKFANKRAEIWGLLRRALDYLALPSNQQLREELISPEYSFNPRGEILLESKDLMRRRGVPSPDLADALACTYASEVAMLPALSDWVQPQTAISEYDPYSDAAMRGEPYPEAKRGAFVDAETGYSFRMRSRWDNDRGFTRDDWADAQASDDLRKMVWEEPE
jgi:hypothetical protein